MSIKRELNFANKLVVCFNSAFACVFCYKFLFKFWDSNVTIEHIFCYDKCRKDIKNMMLSCMTCNIKSGNKIKPFDVEAMAKKNVSELSDENEQKVLNILAKYNFEHLKLYKTKAIQIAETGKTNGSFQVSLKHYTMIQTALVKAQINVELKRFNELSVELNRKLHEMQIKDLESIF